MSGIWNSSRVAAGALWNEQAGLFVLQHTLYWNFMYLSRIFLSVGGSVWYVVRNHRYTVPIDPDLANSKTHNAFLFPVHAMFRHDCPLAVKPASTPQCLVHKKTWRDPVPIDMLPFGVTILATVPQRSEIQEGLMNYRVYTHICLCHTAVLHLESKEHSGTVYVLCHSCFMVYRTRCVHHYLITWLLFNA
jgi:hypothetical protein